MSATSAPVAADDLPASFICPLTQEVMVDPVIDPEGNSYERAAIVEWLKRQKNSPITRNPLAESQLTPNRALKELIVGRLGADYAGSPPVVAAGGAGGAVSGAVVAHSGGMSASVTLVPAPARGEVYAVATITPPDDLTRDPVDICAVVDVSGSMGSESTITGADGKTESHGLSLLDIVKHAVRTIVAVLKPTDRFSLVTFSRTATVVLPLTDMSAAGKGAAQRAVAGLEADGNTNLWDGLQSGLNVLKDAYVHGRNQSVVLLTDGEPNVIPPRGHVPMLLQYKEKFPLMAAVNTFGFGYSLDSELLDQLASEGGGQYAFIPDSSLVGTIFVHTLANVLSTSARQVTAAIEPADGIAIADEDAAVLGGLVNSRASWGASVSCGTVTRGQPRDIVVRMTSSTASPVPPSSVAVTFRYAHCGSTDTLSLGAGSVGDAVATSTPGVMPVGASLTRAVVQVARSELVDTIRRCVVLAKGGKRAEAQRLASGLGDKFEGMLRGCPRSHAQYPYLDGMLKDLRGQIGEALSRDDWFLRWGRHFLPSLARAHQMQQCNNFKDPGVQLYGGALFRKIRDEADEAFLKLPPPTPSIPKLPTARASVAAAACAPSGGGRARSSVTASASARTRAASPPVSMSMYHDRYGGCVSGDSVVSLADQSTKPANKIAKGDVVATPCGGAAEIVCVVKTACAGGKRELVQLPGGLKLTGYHPVHVDGVWRFPCQLAPVKAYDCSHVYSFVLRQLTAHQASDVVGVVVNGVTCAVLGHGIAGDAVVSHAYLGTRAVVDDLAALPGYAAGEVCLPADAWSKRDETTGLVCGINWHE